MPLVGRWPLGIAASAEVDYIQQGGGSKLMKNARLLEDYVLQ